MAFTAVDRSLLQKCLQHETGAWNDFVDRFLSLIYHVIHYTSYLKSQPLQPDEVEDIAQEIMLQIIANDYTVLRQFRGESSLASYLTVIARRICVHELNRLRNRRNASPDQHPETHLKEKGLAGLESLEEVQRLLRKLPSKEREIVRLFYLEGRSYEEISTLLHTPVNSIGPILSRAKKRLRGGDPGPTKVKMVKKPKNEKPSV